ncbi:MAG: NfeD family protein [Pseudomonadota bacterium]
MIELLESLNSWHWLALALGLLIIELMAPASFFLWLGLAAAATGILLFFLPMSWEIQWVSFSVFSVLSILSWLSYRKRQPAPTDQPKLNRRGEQYVGRVFTLDEPIVNGVGKVKVDDTSWRVSGPDLGSGEKVMVVGVDGVVFEVQSVD